MHEIILEPMTEDLAKRLFQEFENDPAVYQNLSDFKPYLYNEQYVKDYVEKQKRLGRSIWQLCDGMTPLEKSS